MTLSDFGIEARHGGAKLEPSRSRSFARRFVCCMRPQIDEFSLARRTRQSSRLYPQEIDANHAGANLAAVRDEQRLSHPPPSWRFTRRDARLSAECPPDEHRPPTTRACRTRSNARRVDSPERHAAVQSHAPISTIAPARFHGQQG